MEYLNILVLFLLKIKHLNSHTLPLSLVSLEGRCSLPKDRAQDHIPPVFSTGTLPREIDTCREMEGSQSLFS